MKFFRQGVALAILGAGLAATPQLTAQAAPTAPAPDDRSLVQQIRDGAAGSVTVTKEKATGRVGFVRAGVNGDLAPDVAGSPVAKADAFLDDYAAAFGAPASQLTRENSLVQGRAGTTVTYTQRYRGVPVFGTMLRAHLDKGGDLTSVNGYTVPGLDLSVDPRLTERQAAQRALTAVKADPPGHDGEKADTAGIKAVATDLVVYRTGANAGQANGENKLVYVVEVSNGANVRDKVFVDANADKLVNRYSMVHDALEREIYEKTYPSGKVFDEGDGDDPNTLNVDQRNIYEGSGESYWFFKNGWNRDSYDGAGATMRIVNNDPRISCPNANWNGTTTNYCNGVTSDDVVAHEWGHAYTEYTHGLIYQYQPGALNESYSDIWGETVDLINNRMDEEEGDISAKRPDGQCSTHTSALPQLLINSPAAIKKICAAGSASFGPQVSAAGLTKDIVLSQDPVETTAGSTATDGCSALTNASAVNGKIALVDRGGCPFTQKVKNAQNAGAAGVVIGNNADSVQGMSGDDASITIPSVLIKSSDRNRIVSGLASSAVNVTMRDASGSTKADSYRWLMGEDSTAFGGAIRDMWSPTCLGDPGKVSDAEYVCGTEDSGGVHSNSGVPNHGYALAVDGGSYNGVTVQGIGLTKAAAIYFQAMTAYQTPTSDFVDHADALTASCTDLVGKPLQKLSTKTNDAGASTEVISTTDCATIGAIIQAVELKTAPTQCNYQPMHNQNRPALCDGKGRGASTVFEEDFEGGIPSDWDADVTSVYGHPGEPWVATDDAPTGNGPAHPGTVAYGFAGDEGTCDSSTPADFSTRDGLITKIIQLPNGTLRAPKLSFDHYVATENGYDGGNVKYRVNGGSFQVIPAAAYLNNGPRQLSTAAQGNTNPMQGEPGFTGTDGGQVDGSWAQSQVDLSMLGVAGGDEIEFRFDIGRDGCGGVDGWYVDDIAVTICKIKTKTEAVHSPDPSRAKDESKVLVTVVPDGATGTVSGTAVLKDPSGKEVGRAPVTDGKASFTLARKQPVGTRTFTVDYLESNTYLGSSDDVVVRVVR